MRKLLLAVFLATALASCSTPQKIPDITLEPVKAEDVIAKPDAALMQPSPEWVPIRKGAANGEALSVMLRNNKTSKELEWKVTHLQKFVCSLYDKPEWKICNK